MIIPKLLATIQSPSKNNPERAIKFQDPEKAYNHLLKLKNTVEVVIRYPVKKVTDPERRWLFGVAYKIIGDELGLTPEEVHYSEPITKLRMDYTRAIPVPKSVSRQGMSTQEFNEYKEKLQMWAAGQGIFIPDPEEVDL